MKPIEPGCQALLIRSVDGNCAGREVTVVGRGQMHDWRITGDIVNTLGQRGYGECPESWLMRIDGDGIREALTEHMEES